MNAKEGESLNWARSPLVDGVLWEIFTLLFSITISNGISFTVHFSFNSFICFFVDLDNTFLVFCLLLILDHPTFQNKNSKCDSIYLSGWIHLISFIFDIPCSANSISSWSFIFLFEAILRKLIKVKGMLWGACQGKVMWNGY